MSLIISSNSGVNAGQRKVGADQPDLVVPPGDIKVEVVAVNGTSVPGHSPHVGNTFLARTGLFHEDADRVSFETDIPVTEKKASEAAQTVKGKNSTYVLCEELGGGGMGQVFLSEDQSSGRKVVVKIPLLKTDKVLQRFENERRFLEALNGHPNVVSFIDSGTLSNRLPFLVEEFVGGGSLESAIKERKVSVGQLLLSYAQIAGALNDAHKKGFSHRDLKPANIFIDNGDSSWINTEVLGHRRVKLGDPGLAGDESRSITRTGDGFGTARYMAPEQALIPISGKMYKPGKAADIFSLGLLIFEALAGKPPHLVVSGEQFSDKFQNGLKMFAWKPTKLSLFYPDQKLAKDFDRLLERMFSLNPEDRIRSVSLLEVQEFLNNAVNKKYPGTLWGQFPSPEGRAYRRLKNTLGSVS